MPRAHVADLLAKSAELAAVTAERDSLKRVVAAQQQEIAAKDRVIALQDDQLKRQERITALADEESGIHRGRAERVEAAACSEVRKARALGFAGSVGGAAAITGVGLPFAPAAAIVAGIVGYLMPCP